ncbi:MAG TPA: hypothetical protein DD670_07450 [Planctomycetaceae bacterium]|nr:hypothetical protein [Planctomycetaceae bacterium]
MSLQFEVTHGGGVPAGLYKTRFVTVEQTEHDEYGAGLKFVFDVIQGDHVGEQATRITGARPTAKNAAGRMLAGLLGETLKPGTTVNLDRCVGKEYLCQVEETSNGGTRIATVMPAGV